MSRSLVLSSVCLLAANVVPTLSASIVVGSRPAYRLEIGKLPIGMRDGRPCVADRDGGIWRVGAPYVTWQNGTYPLYLAYDLAGKDPTLRLTKDKGEHVEWSIVVGKRWYASVGGPREELTSGYELKLRAANGPYRGWYVAAAPAAKGDGKPPAPRPLVLVPDARNAATVRSVEAILEVRSR